MKAIKILEKEENLNWEYDGEADVLYVSVGVPQKALGIDIGEGVSVRYNQDSEKVVGLTIVGVKERLLSALK